MKCPQLSKPLATTARNQNFHYASLPDVTETMDSLFSSTLDTVAPLCLRKIKEKSPTPWYNEHIMLYQTVTMQPPAAVSHHYAKTSICIGMH